MQAAGFEIELSFGSRQRIAGQNAADGFQFAENHLPDGFEIFRRVINRRFGFVFRFFVSSIITKFYNEKAVFANLERWLILPG
jgi:hypothetical protein